MLQKHLYLSLGLKYFDKQFWCNRLLLFEKYWTESGRGDGQGDMEKKDHQLYRRPYMMGKARGKEEEEEEV